MTNGYNVCYNLTVLKSSKKILQHGLFS